MLKPNAISLTLLTAGLLLSPTLEAQSPTQVVVRPPDVSGWRATRWGMSEDQVKRVVPGRWRASTREEREDDRDTYVPFVLKDVTIRGRHFIGLFGFSRTDRKLVAVTLHSGLPLIRPEEATATFEQIVDELEREFGSPAEIVRNNSGHTSFYADFAIWRFRSSVISLECLRPNDSERAIALSYAPSSGN